MKKRCIQAYYDNYFCEYICHKYDLPCCVACETCREPEWKDENK